MNDVEVLEILFDALDVMSKIAGPLLGASLAIGVLVSIVQTVTQIQEQTLTFVPKLGATAAILVFAGGWMIESLISWVTGLWTRIGSL
jgi:flagellar biosynthetic protein FliQ